MRWRRAAAMVSVIGALLAAAPKARACLNDRHLEVAEREFRSSYGEDAPAEPVTALTRVEWPSVVIGITGFGILALGVYTGIQMERRP